MALKYSNLGTTPVKITEVLQKSAENRQEFDENLQSLSSRLKINKNCIAFCKNCAEVLKIRRNLERCKGKNVDLVKSFPTSYKYLLAKIGFDLAENEPPKGPKNVCSKEPRWR